MADATPQDAPLDNIPDLAELRQRLAQAEQAPAKEQAVRQLLQVFDPQPQDAQLTYRHVLERVATVLARELQAPSAETPAHEPEDV